MANVGFSTIEDLSNEVVTEFQIRFNDLINKSADLARPLIREIVTSTQSADVPFVNKWITLSEYEINENPDYKTIVGETINRKIKKFAKGIEISKTIWSDPASQSLLMTQLDGLVAEAAWLRTRRVAFSLANGDSSAVPAYDGQNLFSNTHTLNGTTVDNLLSGLTLNAANFNTAKNVLQQIPLGDDGTYLPTEGADFYLIVPPALEGAAHLTLRSTTIYEDNKFADNPYKGMANLIVSSLLTDQSDWYIVMTLPGISPFMTVRHTSSTASLIPRVAETDPNVIERNMYLWNLQMLEETYPIHWYQMVKVTNT